MVVRAAVHSERAAQRLQQSGQTVEREVDERQRVRSCVRYLGGAGGSAPDGDGIPDPADDDEGDPGFL